MELHTLLVLAEADPVARAVGERWGIPPSIGRSVEGTPIRLLSEGIGLLRRPGLHIHDVHLAAGLNAVPSLSSAVVVFPSIHRSESGTPCFTVHPLGNLGPEAEVGGRPRGLVPSAPRRMTAALRALAEAAPSVGLTATFEATHHGPWLEHPSFFAEIGFGSASAPPPAAVEVLARVLTSLAEEPKDRVVLGVGGGHYAPHFTQLALSRTWSFGHLISRHSFQLAERRDLAEALRRTPGAEGILYARTADAEDPRCEGLGPRLRDAEATERSRLTPTAFDPASGT